MKKILILALAALPLTAAKITICHYPPGNPENPRTIEVSDQTLPTHIGPNRNHNGDTLGPCQEVVTPPPPVDPPVDPPVNPPPPPVPPQPKPLTNTGIGVSDLDTLTNCRVFPLLNTGYLIRLYATNVDAFGRSGFVKVITPAQTIGSDTLNPSEQVVVELNDKDPAVETFAVVRSYNADIRPELEARGVTGLSREYGLECKQ